MRALFRACNERRVRYLLLGGQACVLYGASYFTQDTDLWVQPTPGNLRALLDALERLGARVHKLTPPLTLANVLRGHGFHFRIPQRGLADAYVDVMGRPPRVGAFTTAARRASRMESPWGPLPVVSIEDLVELKKTNRPGDYDVITRLALIRAGRDDRPSRRLLGWAIRNVFGADELWTFVRTHGERLGRAMPAGFPAARLLHAVWRRGREPGQVELSRAARLLSKEAARLQDLGRAYWLPRLRELRRMRAAGELLTEGVPVSRSLWGRPST